MIDVVLKSHFSLSESDNLASGAYVSRAHAGNREYGEVYSRRNRNDYFVYTLSETKLDIKHNKQLTKTRNTTNGEPVVVVSNLDSDQDITTMVDQLLSNDEFSQASSIFVVVPTSDDNDSVYSSDCSTICIQASQHCPKWNPKQTNTEEPGKHLKKKQIFIFWSAKQRASLGMKCKLKFYMGLV